MTPKLKCISFPHTFLSAGSQVPLYPETLTVTHVLGGDPLTFYS